MAPPATSVPNTTTSIHLPEELERTLLLSDFFFPGELGWGLVFSDCFPPGELDFGDCLRCFTPFCCFPLDLFCFGDFSPEIHQNVKYSNLFFYNHSANKYDIFIFGLILRDIPNSITPQTTLCLLPILVGLLVLPCTHQYRQSPPPLPSPFFPPVTDRGTDEGRYMCP